MAADDPESRLRAYLDNVRVRASGLRSLALSWQRAKNGASYTPRVEIDPEWLSSVKLDLDEERPLGEQLFVLSAQGVKVDDGRRSAEALARQDGPPIAGSAGQLNRPAPGTAPSPLPEHLHAPS